MRPNGRFYRRLVVRILSVRWLRVVVEQYVALLGGLCDEPKIQSRALLPRADPVCAAALLC